jgi:hypothetical protein
MRIFPPFALNLNIISIGYFCQKVIGGTISRWVAGAGLGAGLAALMLGILGSTVAAERPAPELTLPEAVTWLEKDSQRAIRASRRVMKDGTAAFPPQVGSGYEAFWLRDYEYTLEGAIGAYSDTELLAACRLFVKSLRDDGAGVDCVKFDGTPLYMPGYGTMGQNPVADGSQFTVGVAWHTYRKTQNQELLKEILDPLIRCLRAVPLNPKTGLVFIDPELPWDRCPYGFTDTIRKKGDVLFCSLLWVQSCRQLSQMLHWAGRDEESKAWEKIGAESRAGIRKVFWDPQVGLFRAASVACRQHDIWGSAFAVYLGVAEPSQSVAIANYFKNHYAGIVRAGQIRHLPGGEYWEQGCARDTYQNGGFWATPTGWFVYTLDLVDPALADRTIVDLVRDFQKSGSCEWLFGDQRHLPDYLASTALPLAGIREMMVARSKRATELREQKTD